MLAKFKHENFREMAERFLGNDWCSIVREISFSIKKYYITKILSIVLKPYHFFYISEKKVTKHFVTYKILTALFFLVILVLTLVMLYIKTEWFKFYFIYATNWTFILMTFGAILEAILVIVRYRGEKNISNWQFIGTISIWISSMTYAGEMLITFCYWTAIHDWTSTNTKYNDAAFYFNLTHHLAPVSMQYAIIRSVEIS